MPKPAKMRFTHDAVIDEIIANPTVSQNELAEMFGYTAPWMSMICTSDAFKARLAERKADIVDPVLAATVKDRLNVLANGVLDRLIKRVESELPLKPAELVAIGKLAVGNQADRPPAPAAPPSNSLYVLNLPPPAASADEWIRGISAANHSPSPAAPLLIQEYKG